MKDTALNFQKYTSESVMDFPKESLCTDIWEQSGNTWTLRPEVYSKLMSLATLIAQETQLDFNKLEVHITGSITSNSYTDKADVDMHFQFVEGYAIRELSTVTQNRFKKAAEKIKESSPELFELGTHPVEIYFQPNRYQDYMSVGCYNLKTKEWLVGPELTDLDFNPYDEYYNSDFKHISKIIGDIRNIILAVYELASTFDKFSDKKQVAKDIISNVKKAAKIFEDVRQYRKIASEPKSIEQALKLRKDKKWKIADSSFKLLDKFGYLAILRLYTQIAEYIKEIEIDGQLEQIETLPEFQVFIENIKETVAEKLGQGSQNIVEDEISIKKVKVWIDDIHTAPDGYTWLKTVNDALLFIDNVGYQNIEVFDIDYDAGEFYKYGGDYDNILKYLELLHAKNINIHIHSQSQSGISKLEALIQKNKINGWNEISLDESLTESLLGKALLISLLTIPGILPAKNISSEVSKLPKTEFRQASEKFQASIKKATKDKAMIGNFSKVNTINIIAWTLYCEAAGEPKEGRDAVASVILNRANGEPEKMLGIVLARKQFSGWNAGNPWGLVKPTKDSEWKYRIPKDALQKNVSEKWKHCVDLAEKLVEKKFTSTIGNKNCYMNKDTASQENVDSWGKLCTLKIGKHSFGYQKQYDGSLQKSKTTAAKKVVAKTKQQYTLKKGDTLSSVAKSNKKTLKQILDLNPTIKDPNKVSVGQKIFI